MSANLENSAVARDWKRSVFIPIPKKGNLKECLNYHTLALISHASKVMLKILPATTKTWHSQKKSLNTDPFMTYRLASVGFPRSSPVATSEVPEPKVLLFA